MPLGDVWGNSWGDAWNSSWKQSAVTPVQAPQRLNVDAGGGKKKKEKEDYYRRLTEELLERYHALEERTLPPPEVPAEPPKVEVVMKPYLDEVGILRNKVFRAPKPDKRLTQTLKKLEADAVQIRKRIQRELDIKRIDEEVAMIAAMLDD